MKKWLCCIVLLCSVLGFAQNNSVTDSLHYKYPDSTYLEDQFYAGMVYNVLMNKPGGLSQNNFSNGFLVGFIKDIPINKARNKGFGVGIGYNNASFYYNIRATRGLRGRIVYDYIDNDTAFKRSKIETHAIEMPIEYRWRTSTAASTKFWRIYTGVRLSYAFARISKYIDDAGTKDIFTNKDIVPFQYSAYISAGYGTWNIYGSISLTKLFKDGVVMESTGEAINMSYFNAGLIFYIL